MRNYFIFLPDGGGYIDSRDWGLHIPELPPIVQPRRRVEKITIPGRNGTVTREEGEDVYDSYPKTFDIIATDAGKLQSVLSLLRGSGKMIFSNEPEYRYTVSIDEGLQFNRMFRDWRRAALSLDCFPFKELTEPQIFTADAQDAYITFDIVPNTDVACPFVLDLDFPQAGPGAYTLNMYGASVFRGIRQEDTHITIDAYTGGFFGNVNGGKVGEWVLFTGDFPKKLRTRRETEPALRIMAAGVGGAKLTIRGWFL